MSATARYFQNPTALPTMPELATRLLRSLERDDLSLGAVAELIGRDQSLSAKVLRLANSAHYSRRQTVGSLREASMLIGLRGLRDIALAACMSGMFPAVAGFDRARFWRHGVATAGNARTLATQLGADADQAYLGGLVLRTGRILMLMQDAGPVLATEAAATAPDSLLAAELALLGCTHAEVSAELARRWRFPAELSDALQAAADPLAAQPWSALGGLLRLASTLADAGERELEPLAVMQSLQAPLIERLQLDLDALEPELLPFDALTIGVDQLLG
jgi:HD-like signal output (HDOD) protein